jgi:phage baseplate assembly protein W
MANGITYGINFPFLQSEKGNYFKLTETTDEEIRTNLVHLLLTRRGYRYYLPDFGTRLYEYIFEPLDGATFEEIRAEIEEQVATYIPNLTINSITVEPYSDSQQIEGDLNYEQLGQANIYRIPGANTEEYTAKIKIDYTNDARAFGSRQFVIINI